MLDKHISYRRATIEDVGTLAEYRVQFLNELANVQTHPKAPQLKTELTEYFAQSISDGEIVVWVAEVNSKIVSTSCLVIWHAPLNYQGLGKKGRRGYILNMFTLKEFRRKGIASILLNKLKEEATLLNLEMAHLHATDDGMKIYRELGFEEPTYPELKLSL